MRKREREKTTKRVGEKGKVRSKRKRKWQNEVKASERWMEVKDEDKGGREWKGERREKVERPGESGESGI